MRGIGWTVPFLFLFACNSSNVHCDAEDDADLGEVADVEADDAGPPDGEPEADSPPDVPADTPDAGGDDGEGVDTDADTDAIPDVVDAPEDGPPPRVVSCADEATAKTLGEHSGLVADLARAEPVEVGVELARPEDAAAAVLTKAQVFVKIAVDVAAETERLKKQLAKEEAYLAKLEGKLRNRNYLDRAPKDVIERDRAAREEALGRVQQLRENLKALG